jgi:hypothetical protein
VVELIEWRILKQRKIMEKSLCDAFCWFLCLTLDYDHELRMEEFFWELLMVEMKSFRLPAFLGTLIEDIFIECQDQFRSEHEHMPPGREEKSETLRFKWLEREKKWDFISRGIECVERTEKFIHEISLFFITVLGKREIPAIGEIDRGDDRFSGGEFCHVHSVSRELEFSELGVELGLEGLHDRLVSWERIGELSASVGEPEDKMLVFEELRESFEKSLKFLPSTGSRVVDAQERGEHGEIIEEMRGKVNFLYFFTKASKYTHF